MGIEPGKSLLIGRVIVAAILYFDSRRPKQIFVEIALCRWTGQIVRRTQVLRDGEQATASTPRDRQRRRTNESRVDNSEAACESLGGVDQKLDKQSIAATIHRLEKVAIIVEKGRSSIGTDEAPPMFTSPVAAPIDLDLVDLHSPGAQSLALDRDGEPKRSVGTPNSIAIAPAADIECHIVVEDKGVGLSNLMKIPSPRDV
jgi:hypothetical protein